jgi:hypothetical protein
VTRLSEILDALKAARGQTRGYQGDMIPEGAGLLLDLLETEDDETIRAACFDLLAVELGLSGKTELGLKVAERRLDEFGDSVSHIYRARALLRAGKTDEASRAADAAIEMALAEDAFVNDTMLSAVRLAVESRDQARVGRAVRVLLTGFRPKARGDLRFESDWLDEARALGVDPGLLDQVSEQFAS